MTGAGHRGAAEQRLASNGWFCVMNNARNAFANNDMAREHLKLANRHVFEGRERVKTQAALAAKLARDGHDIAQAEALLEQFEKTLALQTENRERILRELGEAS